MSTTLHADDSAQTDATPLDSHKTRSRGSRDTRARRPRSHSLTIPYLLLGVAVWAFLGFVIVHLGENGIARGVWMLLGAALAPSALVWAMSHRLTPTDTLTGSSLVRAMVLGGFGAVVIGASFDTLVGLASPPVDGVPSLLSLLTSGVVEEAAKAALVVAVGWNVAKTVRNGLFLGGAVGAGFAVYETLGYIMGAMFSATGGVIEHPTSTQAEVAFSRSLVMPFMHPIWAALLGAAIFAAARNERFRLTLGVVGTYLGVAALHGLWDGGAGLTVDLTTSPVLREVFAAPQHIVIIIAELLLWRHVARRHGRAPSAEVTAS
jgi:RsiW-degrading membrane proteinase PrsW (M82 family)